jgi:DNA modification methylase
MEVNKIYQGDALGVLKTLPDKFVNCCVTSPPYYGLRSYQTNPVIWDNDENCQHEWGNKILPRNSKSGKHSEKSCIGAKKAQDDARRTLGTDFCSKCGAWRGELGAEPTPELYVKHLVEIFREVKRVLKDDGTVWLNLGDSYFGSGGASGQSPDHTNFGKKRTERSYASEGITRNLKHNFLKPKDLVGIPWAVAKALRDPYYTGSIKNELDRVWLAAMIDAEGCICGSYHIRKDDGRPRTNISITITNTNELILNKAFGIFPEASRHIHENHYEGHLGTKDSWRWIVFSTQGKQKLISEIYPYLIAKKKQAKIAWNFLEYQKKAKHYGKTPQMQEVRDLRKEMITMISMLNKGEDFDLPTWMKEPESLWEQGWYLRQDIIWAKNSCMPESVTDRCTKSHEYIFLLSKSQKYYYDYEAILEEATGYDGRKDTMFKGGVKYDGFNQQTMLSRGHERWRYKNLKNKGQQNHSMHEKRANGESDENYPVRNKRSVWTVNPQPFKESHFAVFPEALIEPMILAGSPENGVILDPFMGAGTTGLVARKLNRNYIGFELNPEYIKIAENRILPIEEIKEIGYAKTKISKDHPTLF